MSGDGKAPKSGAQRQKEWRERQKADGKKRAWRWETPENGGKQPAPVHKRKENTDRESGSG